jgi:hypothetical protein
MMRGPSSVCLRGVPSPIVTSAERVLYHQVHPLKLAGDIGSTIVAIPLLWSGDLLLGLVVAFGIPVIASAAVLRWVPLDPIAQRPIGAYLRRYMTPPVQAVRLVLGVSALAGAWWHWPILIAAAVVGVALAWAHGLLRP